MAYADKHRSRMYFCLAGSSIPNENGTFNIFITYDETLNKWRKVGETPDANFSTVISMNQNVYMFSTFPSVFRSLDILLKKWNQPGDLQVSRQDYSVTRYKDRIFAIGGHFPMTFLPIKVVEYFLPPTNSWFFTSSLPPMSVEGSAVADNKLYVVGFCKDCERSKMKALVYDSIFGTWSDIIPPNIFRKSFATIAFKEKIFILGGRNEDNCRVLNSVQSYDPIKNVWQTCESLMYSYVVPKAVVIGEKLIVYENHSGGERIARLCSSIWNEEKMSWESDTISKYRDLYRYTICPIEDPFVLNELARENENPGIKWINSPF